MAKPAKILIIDDDPDFRASVTSLLSGCGYVVFEAASGKEGLEKLAQYNPDLILLDIMMECCVEGYGVNQAVKWRDEYRAWRRVPVVMISSIQEGPEELFPMAPEAAMIQPDYYITKPLDIPTFLETVRMALERGPSGGAGA